MPDLPRTSYLCPVIIGRAAEIDALRGFLARDNGVLLISGEAGIGKSRLVQETRSIAEAAGIRSLVGRSFEADRALPYAPVIDVLQTLVELHGATGLARLAGPATADLARLLPELLSSAVPVPPTSLDAESAKRRLRDGFARLMLALSKQQPLLLVIEDIHWPDASSLELMLHLARRASRGRLYLLLTYRSDEVHPELGHLLATLDRERLANEISLDRLDALHVADMLRAIFTVPSSAPAALLHAVFSLTDGNPFFIEEVLTALGAKQRLVTPDGKWDQEAVFQPHIPRSVNDAVRQRVDLLSDAARNILTLAAVAGRRFDFELLGALSGKGEPEFLDLMRELISAQLVVEEDEDRFVFRHALTREAIHTGLLDRERRRLHRQIADSIAERASASAEQRLDDLSDHYYAAGAWPEALDVARRAGMRAAALHATRAAAEHFSRAIDAARRLSLPTDGALHQARGRAFETLGEFDRALADFQVALEQARADSDLSAEWQALVDLSLLWSARDYRQTGAFAERALHVARDLADPSRIARSLNRLGNWRLNREEPRQAIAYHLEALQILEALGDTPRVAETLDLLGMASVLAADASASNHWYSQAIDAWRLLADSQGLAASTIGLTIGAHNFHTSTIPPARSIEEVRSAGEESLALCRDIGWRAGEAMALWGFHGMTLGAAGHYDLALAATRRAIEITHDIGHQQWLCAARCMLGNLHADLGEFRIAQDELQAALALARQIDSPYWVRSAAGWLVSTLTCAGKLEDAETVLAAELHPDIPWDTIAGRLLWGAKAELALARGDPSRALDILDRLLEVLPDPSARPVARLERARSAAFLALGRPEEAEAVLRCAREEAAWSGARPLLWRIDVDLGQLYQGMAQSDAAMRAFGDASAVIEELASAVPSETLRTTLLTMAARQLPRASGAAARASSLERATPLTKRELQVAALLKDGLTNREIGERLFLSEWTAATHVRNILAKLSLSSRAQIAAWAASHDLTPDA